MRKNIKNNLLTACCLIVSLFTSCISNEEGVECPRNIAIHVSVDGKDVMTRASDLLDIEKIKSYDIFIYDSSSDTDAPVKHIGKSNLQGQEQFTEEFLAGTDYLTAKDVYVVVNYDWNGKTPEEIEVLTKTELEAIQLDCKQNFTGTDAAHMTEFGGYKNTGTSEYEPFVMSRRVTGHDFRTTPTLNMELKRTYAKVVLQILSSLPEGEDNTAWKSLKSVSVNRVNNVATQTRLFKETGSGYTPTAQSFEWLAGKEYEKTLNDVDVSTTGYVFDTFPEDNLRLRIFPHAPADAGARTSLGLGFKVGPAGSETVTKEFHRNIEIGDKDNGYRIDPNTAYVITVRYGKTDSSVSVTYEVVPWYLIYFDDEVTPQ